jgi:hypothetical protein
MRQIEYFFMKGDISVHFNFCKNIFLYFVQTLRIILKQTILISCLIFGGCSSSETLLSQSLHVLSRPGEGIVLGKNQLMGRGDRIPEQTLKELKNQTFPDIVLTTRPITRSETERRTYLSSLQKDSLSGKNAHALVESREDLSKAIPEYHLLAGESSENDRREIPQLPKTMQDLSPSDIPQEVPAVNPIISLPIQNPSEKTKAYAHPKELIPSLSSREQFAQTEIDTIPKNEERVSSIDAPIDFKPNRKTIEFQDLENFHSDRSLKTIESEPIVFNESSFELASVQNEIIRQAIDVNKSKKGIIRIVADLVYGDMNSHMIAKKRSLLALAKGRAEAVGREFVRLGVPPEKLYVGVKNVSSQQSPGNSVKIFIDY